MLSLCMIVKNEENNLLRCLKSVKEIVDEMVIVDTGSTDRTVEIAEGFGANVYYYKWNNDFSAARNFAMDKAEGEWILLMDADDELDGKEAYKIKSLLKDVKIDAYLFETISYVGDRPGIDTLSNLNVRIIKNKAEYRFTGAIHEQILMSVLQKGGIVREIPIRVYHYGYLNQNIKDKDKRKRNMGILEEELKKDPENPFHNFNMGTEYMALGNNEKAYEHFKKAYDNLEDVKTGYTSKLLIRMIMCLSQLNRIDDALKLCNESLKKYADITDIVFLKGMIHHRLRQYSLALKSFMKCVEMGDPPLLDRFITGVGGFKAYYAMGEIYYEMMDYHEAINCYLNSLRMNPLNKDILYKLSDLYFNIYDEKTAADKIKSHFDDSHSSYVILSDIFFTKSKYDLALEYIDKALNDIKNNITYYIKGRILMYMHKYEDAEKFFDMILEGEYLREGTVDNIICRLLTGGELEKPMKVLSEISHDEYIVYFRLNSLLNNEVPIPFSTEKSRIYSDIIFFILDRLLELREFNLFEKALNMLNLVDEKDILLRLGKLYFKHGVYKLAEEELMRSMKLFDVMDNEGLSMLNVIYSKKK
ncbi:MAG: glycosyltransferase [Thermoanaerobacteraceae bacterium]|nr:glycosyltransferase [Thermoanaerobacteraceae bacterium]